MQRILQADTGSTIKWDGVSELMWSFGKFVNLYLKIIYSVQIDLGFFFRKWICCGVIKEKSSFDVDRVLEIEKTTRHDVIAFLTNLAENIGPDSRYLHMGMTSSDLLDTSLAIQCRDAGKIILTKLNQK